MMNVEQHQVADNPQVKSEKWAVILLLSTSTITILVLLSPKPENYFTVMWRVEG